ncbi:MAG: ribonuclease Z [Candidatus Thermoplasmatota archaeon]|nr:ribonuclease Z [Candidatus Thermoplasmatota archaeon]
MKIVFLGTGGTYPSKLRNVTSIAVQMPGEVVMFDCGEGTQRQLMHSSVSFMKIRKIFISHLHADHFLGIPGLIQSMSLNGREDALEVFGPNGTSSNVRSMLRLGYFKSGFEVETKDIEPDEELDFSSYTVRCVEAEHTVPSLAYALQETSRPGRFDVQRAEALGIPEGPMFRKLQQGRPVTVKGRRIEPGDVLGPARAGRKVVYSGDTRPSPRIVELARDADVLIHDCTLDSSHSTLAADFGHSTAAEAATVAKEASVGMLFLVHLSPRYESHEVVEEEARSIFMNSKVAEDLSEYVVRYRD